MSLSNLLFGLEPAIKDHVGVAHFRRSNHCNQGATGKVAPLAATCRRRMRALATHSLVTFSSPHRHRLSDTDSCPASTCHAATVPLSS